MLTRSLISMLLVVASSVAQGQDLLSKPVRLLIPYPAGGVVDVVGRILSNGVAANLKTPVVVENRVGGNTIIATEAVLQAPPDGHTWLLAPIAFATNASLFQLRWDPARDFTPAARYAVSPDVFLVPATSPAKSVAEYVALAKRTPGSLNYGAPGIGGASHLAFELFKRDAGIDVTMIPYQGTPPVLPDLINGQVSGAFIPASVAIGQLKSGKVRALAIVSPNRSKALPEVPTFSELGYPRIQNSLWMGVVLPPKTPEAVVSRVAREIERVTKSADALEQLEKVGAEPAFLAPEQFAAFIRAEMSTWGRVIKEAGIKPQ